MASTDLIGPEIRACMVVTSDTGFMKQSEVNGKECILAWSRVAEPSPSSFLMLHNVATVHGMDISCCQNGCYC